MGYIYKITNILNNHNYIGQTKNTLENRLKQHLKCSNKDYIKNYFHSAIKKYGKNNFKISLVEEVDDADLNEKEIYWIKYFKSIGEANYNIAAGGYNNPFEYLSKDEKSKIAKKSWETFLNNHTKEEIDEINKKKGMPGEKNPNFGGSINHKLGCMNYHINNPGIFNGSGNPFYGKHHSEETKKILSEKLLGNKNHPQNGENNTNYGKRGIESSNHKEVSIIFSNGESMSFGSRKELGEYFGYSNGNKPPMNKILKSKKFPILNGAIVIYK